MSPPNVYDVTTPSSHNTHNTTSIVQIIAIPISQRKYVPAIVTHLEIICIVFQVAHRRCFGALCLFTCAHSSVFIHCFSDGLKTHKITHLVWPAASNGDGANSFNCSRDDNTLCQCAASVLVSSGRERSE